MKAPPLIATASFRQNLIGQLIWLEVCPHWACAEVYAARIHPLIVQQKRDDPSSATLQDLIERLNETEPHKWWVTIKNWLEANPDG